MLLKLIGVLCVIAVVTIIIGAIVLFSPNGKFRKAEVEQIDFRHLQKYRKTYDQETDSFVRVAK